MSYGVVICSGCRRELHQGEGWSWYHCEDGTARCEGQTAIYPESTDSIEGEWCGADDLGYEKRKKK